MIFGDSENIMRLFLIIIIIIYFIFFKGVVQFLKQKNVTNYADKSPKACFKNRISYLEVNDT